MGDNVLRFDFLARDRGASATFDKLAKKSDTLAAKLGKFGKVAGAALATAGIAAATAGPRIVGYAAKLEQMGTKAQTVFGGQIGSVEKWAKVNASAMGLTARTATGLAANFGDLLIPMGFTRKEAATMSTKVVGLSGALAQWSGGTKTAAEVSQSLAKAMLGEREELKSLGISITDADVKARLLAKGQDKLTGSALAQAKAMATQELIFEKSKDAQAAYAKGSGTLIGKVDQVKAVFKGWGESLVVSVTPAIAGVLTFVTDKLLPGLSGLGTFVRDTLVPRVVEGFKGLKTKIEGALPTIDLSGIGADFAAQAKGWATSIIGGVRTGLDIGDWKPLGGSIGRGVVKAVEGAGKFAGQVASKLGDWLGKVDWLDLGIKVGKQAVPLLVGIAIGLLNFDLWGLIKGLGEHWQEALFAVLAVAFAPAKLIGAVAKQLARVPLVGRLLAWGLTHFAAFSRGLVGMVGKAISFMGKAFIAGFRRIFPGVGESFAKSLSLLPIRLGLIALAVRARAIRMMRGLAGAIAGGIGRVIANIGELIARMLRPFARAGAWLIGKGRQFVSGLREGIADRARDLGGFLKTRIVDRITGRFSNAGRWLILSGRRLLAGLFDGMLEKVRDAGRWARTIGGTIVRAVKGYFGIRSPSTVFAGIGRHLVTGLFKGMVDSNPVRTISKIFGSMPKALGALVDKGMVSITSLPGKALNALQGLGGKFANLLDGFGTGSGGGGGTTGGLIAFGKWLQSMGYTVTEHPAFGGVGTHSRGSLHYSGQAIDVNAGAGTSAAEQSRLAKIIGPAHQAGFRTIFMAPGHYNHAHVSLFGGGVIPEEVFGVGKSGRTYSFGERGPETVIPGQRRAARGGTTINVTINAAVGSHPREIGRELVRYIRAYEKSN